MDFRSFWRRTFPPSIESFETQVDDLRRRIDDIAEGSSHDTMAHADPAGLVERDEVASVLRFLRPCRVGDTRKARYGSRNDGGYIMSDDLNGVDRALSLGVNDNDDWEKDIVKHGIPVDQYDDSVDAAPTADALLTFHRKRVVATSEEDGVTLSAMLERPVSYLLKMDIEGSEWNCLASTPSPVLARCPQIVVEFHDLHRLVEQGFRNRAASVLAKLGETHRPIHVHANNYAPCCMVAGIPIPDVLEVTFVRSSSDDVEPSNERFPTSLDSPNDPARCDIFLGTFTF